MPDRSMKTILRVICSVASLAIVWMLLNRFNFPTDLMSYCLALAYANSALDAYYSFYQDMHKKPEVAKGKATAYESLLFWKCFCGYENSHYHQYDGDSSYLFKCDGCGERSQVEPPQRSDETSPILQNS